MKWVKRIGLSVFYLPAILFMVLAVLFVAFIAYQYLGMGVDHYSTKHQTDTLQARLEASIHDIRILDIYSETGNTSGTGNHVDCLTAITFSSELPIDEIEEAMAGYYRSDMFDHYLEETDGDAYRFCLIASAPFPDNIEGH